MYSNQSHADDPLRANRHLPRESRRDNTGRGSARKSASTNAKRDADIGVETTLTGKEPHERELQTLRSDLVTN